MREIALKRTTMPEEEGIELHPDAMERLERVGKAAARRRRHGDALWAVTAKVPMSCALSIFVIPQSLWFQIGPNSRNFP